MKNYLDIFGVIKGTGIEVLKDYGDTGLEELAKIFDKEILVEIPYVSTIVNIATFGSKIKQYFFAKNLIKFLLQLESIPLEEREDFIKKLENSKESKKVGDNLILIIDSLDDDEKAVILGKLFKRTIEGKITIDTFHRLAIGIKNIYLEDLLMFIEWHSQSQYNLHEDINSSLYQNSFLSLKLSEVIRPNYENITLMALGERSVVEPTLEFKISELGFIFLNNYK